MTPPCQLGHERPLPCLKFKITMGKISAPLSLLTGSIGPNTN